jgi:hypothetical protein
MAITMNMGHAAPVTSEKASTDISATTAGFGMSAAFVAVFNTVFAWVKDATPALEHAMKNALGHHWTTHGVVDVIVFLVLGYLLARTQLARRMDGNKLAKIIIGAVVLGGLGLAGWFFLV